MPKAKKTASKALKAPATPPKGIQKPQIKHVVPRSQPSRPGKFVRKAITPVLDCDLEQLIDKRSDQKLLEDHFKAIDGHKQKYENRIKDITDEKKKTGNVARMGEIPAHKAKITEAKGEREATVYMLKQEPDCTMLSGFSAGIGIDQIWASGSPIDKYVLVEAKGPGATLSTNAAKGDQMSKQWVLASLQEIMNSGKSSNTDKAHAKIMYAAIVTGTKPPAVEGRVIEARHGGGADLKGCPDKGLYN